MAYATYNDYQNIYFGNAISSNDFLRLSERASEEIDVYTLNRLDDELPEDKKLAKKIIKATCAVAEILAMIEQINVASGTDAEGKGKIIASETTGNISTSYAVQKNLLQQQLEETNKQVIIYDAIYKHLNGTNLLYRGLY